MILNVESKKLIIVPTIIFIVFIMIYLIKTILIWTLLALILFSIFMIQMYKKPVIALGLIIFLAFTGASRLLLPKLFIVATFATVYITIIRMMIDGELKIRNASQNWGILVFITVFFTDMLFAHSLNATYVSMVNLLRNLIFYFLFINLVTRIDQFRLLTWILLISGFTACIVGIYIIFSTGFAQIFLSESRFGSVLGNPNWFAGTIVPLIPISYFFIKNQKRLSQKIFLSLFLLIFLFSVAFSLSRSALLATMIIILFIYKREFRHKKHTLIFIILMFGSIFLFFPELTSRAYQRFENIFSGQDVSVNIRLNVLKAGIRMFLDHPFLGVGPGNFLNMSGRYITLVANKVAHNMYLDVAAEMGLFGIIAFIYIFFSTIIDLRKYLYSQNEEISNLANGFFLGFLGYLITGFFVSVHFYFFLWLILSFSVSFVNICNESKLNNIL